MRTHAEKASAGATATRALPSRATAPASPTIAQLQASIGNQAVLQLLQRKCAACEDEQPCETAAMQCRTADVAVAPADDAHEREADRVAETVASGGAARVAGRVDRASAQRAPACDTGGSASSSGLLRGAGSPLDGATRAYMEARIGHDFGGVRVHVGAEADASTRAVNAVAYTVGEDIAFRSGHYDPASEHGRKLLAHELAHVVQQGRATVLQRKPAAPTSLADRLAAFKQLVKNAGKLRMTENAKALEQWRQFLQTQLTPAQVETQVHTEEARALIDTATRRGSQETAAAEQWLVTRGPNTRWVLEQQIQGRFHACTGCHAAVQASAMDRELARYRRDLRTPLEQLPTAGGAAAAPVFAEGQETHGPSAAFPAVARAQARINAVRPFVQQLGPDGFRVLPPETLGSNATPEQLVADIGRRITQRQSDYRTFRQKIAAPDFDYLQLRPIVRDLLPLADPDVRDAVTSAIKTAEAWETVESIGVGIASIGLLLLAIFPPTSVIGVAGGLALGAAVSTHQIIRGYQSYEQGRLYSLARGANDVLDREQQDAADAMMAMGAVNMVLGSIGLASSALGTVRLLRSAGVLAGAEASAGGRLYTLKFGKGEPYVVEYAPNGQVLRQGPASSFRASATAGPGSSARGGTVLSVEGNTARAAQPEPLPATPAPAAAPARAPLPPIDPSRYAPLFGTMGTTVGAGRIAAIVAAAPPAPIPVMPPGLSLDKQKKWKECLELHDIYKATQAAAAALVTRIAPIELRLHNNSASLQDVVDYCALLDEVIQTVQRLHRERLDYIDRGCDEFDWFNQGRTEAQRKAAHDAEVANVHRQLQNLYELRTRFCP